jgi:hypothetical protein
LACWSAERPQNGRQRHQPALAALRESRQRFALELALLPEIGGDGAPVLYLGGDEGLDVVLDLGHPELAIDRTPGGGAAARRARPAVDRPAGQGGPRFF